MQSQIEFCTLRPQQSQQILKVILDARKDHLGFIHKSETVQGFTEETIKTMAQFFAHEKKYNQIMKQPISYNFGMRSNGKLIAVILGVQIIEQYKLAELNFGKDKGSTLFEGQGIQHLKQGTAVYFSRLSVIPQMMRKGLGKKLIYQASKYLYERGYKCSYVLTFLQVSFGIYMSLGGEVLKQDKNVMPTYTFNIRLIKNDFERMIGIYESSKK